MDFVERVFHVAPDGGSGALESLYVAAILTVATAVVFRRAIVRWLRKWRRGDSNP